MAAKVAAPLAHRQLMDLVLAAQQARFLGEEIAVISKTKVRGVLALLKNAHSLDTSGGSGESVRLYLGKGVVSFRNFREKHDSFVNRCISQQNFFLPVAVKAEVLWRGDEASISERLFMLEQLEPLLERFYTTRKPQVSSSFNPLSMLAASGNHMKPSRYFPPERSRDHSNIPFPDRFPTYQSNNLMDRFSVQPKAYDYDNHDQFRKPSIRDPYYDGVHESILTSFPSPVADDHRVSFARGAVPTYEPPDIGNYRGPPAFLPRYTNEESVVSGIITSRSTTSTTDLLASSDIDGRFTFSNLER